RQQQAADRHDVDRAVGAGVPVTAGGCGGAFGSGGFGSLPFGSGSNLSVLSAAQYALNAVDVVMDGAAQASGSWVPGDALNPSSWTVAPVSAGAGVTRLVQYVERIA